MSRLARGTAALVTAGAALLAPALPAAAAVGDSTVVAEPTTVTAHGDVVVTGTVDWSAPREDAPYGRAQLRVAVDGTPTPVATAGPDDPDTVRWTLTTAPCAPEAVCAGATVLPNGRRVVELWDVARFAADDRKVGQGSVLVDVPAGRPQDVAASLEGRTVTVRWARVGIVPVREGDGTKDVGVVEPDVRWAVSDGAGRTVSATPDDCAEGVCTTTVTYPDGESGARRFTVSASRPCDGCTAGATPSRPSNEVVVPVVPGATPSTPGAGSPTPSAASGGGGRADLGSLGAGLGTFSPGLGTPVLPSLEPGGPPAVAAPELPDTFEETLGYEDRTELEPVPAPRAARPETRLTSTGGGVLGDEQLVRGVAGALVLALSGAHLRTWLSAPRRDVEV